MSSSQMQVQLDRSWFYSNSDKYLASEEFKSFEDATGLSLKDFTSVDPSVLHQMQKKCEEQSVILNEIRKQHFGFAFPYIVYTHTLGNFEPVPNHHVEVDKLIMGLDMCDSLRRRHIALSYGVIPYCLEKVNEATGRVLAVKNLGSGVGLDVIHAVCNQDGRVRKVLNYDTSIEAINLGRSIIRYLETKTAQLRPGVIEYIQKSMTRSDEPADVIIMVGVICGLQDVAARYLLEMAHAQLNPGGSLVISSSNHHMKNTDPLASFLIQHIGARQNASGGWSLNFRTEEQMERLVRDAGFSCIEMYSDTQYPGKEALPDAILYGVDALPARAIGLPHPEIPLNLPSREILDRGIAYNWIAVATKA